MSWERTETHHIGNSVAGQITSLGPAQTLDTALCLLELPITNEPLG